MASRKLQRRSVDLILTSPPFALTRPKDYGNQSHDKYLGWFETFLDGIDRVLSENGSIVVDVGGAYLPGRPQRSTYHFELALLLARRFQLCQEFYWYNPAKLPSPAEWTNVRRVRAKDSVNLVLWLARDAAHTFADNKRVLRRYSESMRSLHKNGYQFRKRPSNHLISDKFLIDNGGAISPNLLGFWDDEAEIEGERYERLYSNLLSIANTHSTDSYLSACAHHGIKPHGARFPSGLAGFFIEFLTPSPSVRQSVVLDPFAGSNTTGAAAEALGRRWISCELDEEGDPPGTYVRASAFRFKEARLSKSFEALPTSTWEPIANRAVPGARRASYRSGA